MEFLHEDGSVEKFREFVGEAKGDFVTLAFSVENPKEKLVYLPGDWALREYKGKRKRALQELYNL